MTDNNETNKEEKSKRSTLFSPQTESIIVLIIGAAFLFLFARNTAVKMLSIFCIVLLVVVALLLAVAPELKSNNNISSEQGSVMPTAAREQNSGLNNRTVAEQSGEIKNKIPSPNAQTASPSASAPVQESEVPSSPIIPQVDVTAEDMVAQDWDDFFN